MRYPKERIEHKLLIINSTVPEIGWNSLFSRSKTDKLSWYLKQKSFKMVGICPIWGTFGILKNGKNTSKSGIAPPILSNI